MVLDWAPSTTGDHITLDAVADVDENGKVYLAFGRGTGANYYRIVAEADGPVRFALYEQGRCVASRPRLNGGHFIFRTYDDAYGGSYAGGAIQGTVGELRPAVLRPPGYSKDGDPVSTDYALGPNAFVESRAADGIYTFPGASFVSWVVQPPEDEGLVYAEYQFRGDDLFWSADSSAWEYVKVWTAGAGVQTLIGYGTDRTRLAGGFGTDGIDMVWEEGSGRTDFTKKIFPVVETWTAKYTTNPEVVRATRRRVRSEYPQIPGNMHNVVGCGYAVHSVRTTSPGLGWRLIRLSDGMAWEGIEAPGDRYVYDRPLAVTCDEIFLSGFVNGRPNIARVRIDSLGPGTPAD
ncbi:hypothetical protein AKJ09_09948 [Labilithrix luteola]|uniref:Uncharacterized protein n=2 Tax=Labilithrix luteola TaxID=1391654 RepID=A0A0K1QCZ2_9BACT|nr:hypothetical protein AKJ09_09948 [Labilithrix luteola]